MIHDDIKTPSTWVETHAGLIRPGGRVLDLALLHTSSTNHLYDVKRAAPKMRFRSPGIVEIAGVPFEILDADRAEGSRNALVLKGGTALNLAFGPPERLSVDLDFNYVGAIERERMLAERPRVERTLDELARRAGYRIQRSADAFAGRKLYLHYSSALGPDAPGPYG